MFEHQDVLPEFNLLTVKAVQSVAANQTEFINWFAALDSMKEQIAKQDFDVAIIGCGTYGMPLASFVKDIGKKAEISAAPHNYCSVLPVVAGIRAIM